MESRTSLMSSSATVVLKRARVDPRSLGVGVAMLGVSTVCPKWIEQADERKIQLKSSGSFTAESNELVIQFFLVCDREFDCTLIDLIY